MKRTDITTQERNDPKHGWSMYRIFRTAESARWYFERMPGEDGREFAIVDGGTVIASRDITTEE